MCQGFLHVVQNVAVQRNMESDSFSTYFLKVGLLNPLGPSGCNLSQHTPTTRLSVERTADKACLLSDRVELSSAEAREEGVQGGPLGVFEPIQRTISRARAEPKSASIRLMVPHG